jgi:hypothetical protein
MFAMEIAADTSQGVGEGAGKEMEERFLFDGVNCFGTDLSIGGGIQDPPFHHPDTTDPVLSLLYFTPVTTE